MKLVLKVLRLMFSLVFWIQVLFGLEYAHALQDIKSSVADTMPLDSSSTSVHYAEVICSVMNPSEDKTRKDHIQSHTDVGVNSKDKLPNKMELRHDLGGLTWNMPVGQKMEDSLLFWIGSEDPAFANLVLTFNNCEVGNLPSNF